MSAMETAWLIPALGFSAFGLIVLFGRYLPRQGSFIAVAAIGGAFVFFWFVLFDQLSLGTSTPQFFDINWFSIGETSFGWGMIIDPLTIVMLGIVTCVALAVQVYSIKYMEGQPRYGWYFAVHSLFAASMLSLVLADNFLLLYVVWELVGLGSYLLIGFWYERRPAAEAAKKAFITTRIGDIGLLIGILLLFKATGTFQMNIIFEEASKLAAGEESLISAGTATTAAILIFLGAMGKSAQFPLHVWLPDAMEGPTPVSALIHAATMVAAGVFLVARSYPLFQAAPEVLLIVAIIGMITIMVASTMALVMTDLKRILAYSTVSHLGFMMLALGAGPLGFTAAVFHLLVHALSKGMLFLAAGSIMHEMDDETDIRKMGGLRRRMPVTAIAFAIGALALAGLPPLSGFFSKDEILLSLFQGRNNVFFVLFLLAAFLSSLYMARMLFTVFFGTLQKQNEKVREASILLTVPIVILALMTVTVGFLALPWTADYRGFGSYLFFEHPEPYQFHIGLGIISTMVSLAGLGFGWLIYGRKSISAQDIQRRYPRIHCLIANRYYLDHLYQWCTVRIVLVLSNLVALFDRVIVNDTGVNGTGLSVVSSAFRLRLLQTGWFYNYALGMVVGVIIVILTWWLAISRV